MPKQTTLSIGPKDYLRAAAREAKRQGTGSFFGDILIGGLRKISPQAAGSLESRIGKGIQAARRADIAAGEKARKIPLLGRIFKEEIRQEVKQVKQPGGRTLKVIQSRPGARLSAPFRKAQKFVVPLLAYEALRRITSKPKPKVAGERDMTRDEQAVMLKAANLIEKLGQEREQLVSMLASALHEKNAYKLARDMMERGLIDPDDFEKKAQELAREPDLGIVKKAVDLAQGGFEIGRMEKVATEGQDSGPMDPMTEYLVGYIAAR